MNESLLHKIRPVARRFRVLRFWQTWATVAAVCIVIVWWLKTRAEVGAVDGRAAAVTMAVASGMIALVVAIVCAFLYRDPRRIAIEIEGHFPSLDQRLLTALCQRGDQLGYLQQRVVKEARDHSRVHSWSDAVPSQSLWISRFSGLGATVVLTAVLSWLAATTPDMQRRAAAGLNSIVEPIVEPGDVEIERGTSLVVTAKFQADSFDRGELVCESDEGLQRTLSMTQNLGDPVLGGFIASVDQPMTYQVRTPFWSSRMYSVDVFDYPAMQRADAELVFPSYTKREPKLVEDTVRVSAVVGSEVTWRLMLNKPTASAELVTEDGERIALKFESSDRLVGTVDFKIEQSRRFRVELVDDAGRKNKYPPELVIRALLNRPPNLKVTPASDSSVSPLEEFPLKAEVVDDFGIDEVGIAYSLDGAEPIEIILHAEIAGGEKTNVEKMLAMEDLRVQPDQLVSYHFFATDTGPDGQPRRTESDMYFAEIRPFEEIYREGQPPPGGDGPPPSGSPAEAEELAELQKEIISATWRVIRDYRGDTDVEAYVRAVLLLAESQTEAIAKLDELASNVSDPASKQFVTLTHDAMKSALEVIEAAVAETDDRNLIRDALPFEQAAYGGLLKLRAREFEVSRSQQQQSQSSSSSSQRKQKALDELELDQDENRYETQSQAQPSTPEEAAQREVRQVLNRLRELARRQEDLNKELAQLQSALEQAETKEEREEIERQLKRLRDQQQDLLRETDELAERMQQSESQSQSEAANGETQEKLQEARENVRKATEALEQQNASEALASGKRAERQFEEMRDEFRQAAAGQFNDAMREMRNDAQKLDDQQKQLTEKMESSEPVQPTPGLRSDSAKGDIEQELTQQKQSVEELLERMEQTVTEAEETEPLLAQKLYDSYRKARQNGVDRNLEDAAELTRRGMAPQANQANKKAGDAVEQLREDLEEAAETVLGDETKALERALSELEKLDRQLQDEMNEKRPPSNQPADSQSSSSNAGENESESAGQPKGESDSRQQTEGGQANPNDETTPPNDSQSERSSDAQEESGQASEGGRGQQPSSGTPSGEANQPGQTGRQGGGDGAIGGFAGNNAAASPLTGDGFREWSDSLRDVEEMVDDPELRSQAARIRDRAREMRIEFRRHSKEPQWDSVEELIATPLRELKRNVSEELMRRSAEKNAVVPIDRDPVPRQFTDAVRRYYERLGSGE